MNKGTERENVTPEDLEQKKHDFLRKTADENDQDFIHRCEQLLPYFLSSTLKGYGQKVIDELRKPLSHPPSKIIFIPVLHFDPTQKEDKELRRDLASILGAVAKPDDLIADGETVSKLLKKNAINRETQTLLRILDELFSPSKGRDVMERMPPDGCVTAILDFLGQHPNVDAAGVDIREGSMIGIALNFNPSFISPSHKSHEARWVFEDEARTRIALNMASKLADGKRIIFVQGVGHGYSVIGWSVRNQVELEIIMPHSILDPKAEDFPREGRYTQIHFTPNE